MSRAYRLLGAGCAEMVDVPRPEPGPDEVLLRVLAAGVCRTDLALLRGGGADGVTLPVTLGHEVVGEVVALGEGLSAPQRGAVMAVLRAARLRRVLRVLAGEHNVAGTSSRGRSAALETAAWPTHVVVPARSLVAVGDVDPVHAAPLTDAAMTALHAVERGRALLEPGAVAVVVGIGGLGHLAVQLLRAMSEVPGTRRRRRPRAPGLRRGDRRRDGIAAGPGAAEDVLAANAGRKVDALRLRRHAGEPRPRRGGHQARRRDRRHRRRRRPAVDHRADGSRRCARSRDRDGAHLRGHPRGSRTGARARRGRPGSHARRGPRPRGRRSGACRSGRRERARARRARALREGESHVVSCDRTD
jgi:NADPH:quinone reductase-like Zn-dependent oxidoreductase